MSNDGGGHNVLDDIMGDDMPFDFEDEDDTSPHSLVAQKSRQLSSDSHPKDSTAGTVKVQPSAAEGLPSSGESQFSQSLEGDKDAETSHEPKIQEQDADGIQHEMSADTWPSKYQFMFAHYTAYGGTWGNFVEAKWEHTD